MYRVKHASFNSFKEKECSFLRSEATIILMYILKSAVAFIQAKGTICSLLLWNVLFHVV